MLAHWRGAHWARVAGPLHGICIPARAVGSATGPGRLLIKLSLAVRRSAEVMEACEPAGVGVVVAGPGSSPSDAEAEAGWAEERSGPSGRLRRSRTESAGSGDASDPPLEHQPAGRRAAKRRRVAASTQPVSQQSMLGDQADLEQLSSGADERTAGVDSAGATAPPSPLLLLPLLPSSNSDASGVPQPAAAAAHGQPGPAPADHLAEPGLPPLLPEGMAGGSGRARPSTALLHLGQRILTLYQLAQREAGASAELTQHGCYQPGQVGERARGGGGCARVRMLCGLFLAMQRRGLAD